MFFRQRIVFLCPLHHSPGPGPGVRRRRLHLQCDQVPSLSKDRESVTQGIYRDCWWYLPVTDQWLSGPRMLRERYEAVAVSLPGPSNGGQHPGGQVWMTGGRKGSNILQKNEVLQYPATFSNIGTSPGYALRRWQWSNEKAKQSEVIFIFETALIYFFSSY